MISKEGKCCKIVLSLFILLVCVSQIDGYALSELQTDRRESVAMRLIGHQLLKCNGDDSSRVSPIVKQKDSYVISFEEPLAIDPTDLERIVSEVMTEHDIAQNYWVEVYSCEDRALIHNYQVGSRLGYMVPCKGRELPIACYELMISIYDPSTQGDSDQEYAAPLFQSLWIAGLIGLVISIALRWWFFMRAKEKKVDPNIISIGSSVFDKKNMHLSYNDQKIELSHKEAELLYLLHTSANTPVKRQVLLSQIWGDDGDYIGRTLDVFISRLRKKLQVDSTVKIVNIRGVGYKLVMGD